MSDEDKTFTALLFWIREFDDVRRTHSINHICFLQNTSCIRKPQIISGRGAHPLHPPPRSAPETLSCNLNREAYFKTFRPKTSGGIDCINTYFGEVQVDWK